MKYIVWAKMTSYAYLYVDAESEEEAFEIAEETDGGEFEPSEDGDWEIVTCNPVDCDVR